MACLLEKLLKQQISYQNNCMSNQANKQTKHIFVHFTNVTWDFDAAL